MSQTDANIRMYANDTNEEEESMMIYLETYLSILIQRQNINLSST